MKWRSLLVLKPLGRSSGSYYQFSHPATSLTRQLAMCTAFSCGAPCSMTYLQRLQRNDRAMIRQICSIKQEDVARVRSSELLAKLQREDLDLILRERRLRLFGHVEHSSGAIRTAYDMQIDGKRGGGGGGGQLGPSKHGRN